MKNISQGWAVFDEVKVEEGQFFEKSLIRKFKEVECNFMTLSILVFLISKSFSNGEVPTDNLKSICMDYYRTLEESKGNSCEKLSALRPRVKKYVYEIIEKGMIVNENWEKDKRLFYMYLQ